MIYWISPKVKYSVWKKVHDAIAVKDGGPAPKHIDRILWELLRDRKLNIYVTDESKDDTIFPTLKAIPKKAKMITNE